MSLSPTKPKGFPPRCIMPDQPVFNLFLISKPTLISSILGFPAAAAGQIDLPAGRALRAPPVGRSICPAGGAQQIVVNGLLRHVRTNDHCRPRHASRLLEKTTQRRSNAKVRHKTATRRRSMAAPVGICLSVGLASPGRPPVNDRPAVRSARADRTAILTLIGGRPGAARRTDRHIPTEVPNQANRPKAFDFPGKSTVRSLPPPSPGRQDRARTRKPSRSTFT